jgi:hypothetical protein
MRTLRLSLVGTLMLVLLGGLGSAVVAQMDADPEAVYFTATGQVTDEGVAPGMLSVGDLWSWRDGAWTVEVEASDPRASGTWSGFANADVDDETGHGIEWGTLRVENAGGTWVGPYTAMWYTPPEGAFTAASGMLVGDGDYAGYTMNPWLDVLQNSPVGKFHGVIFKGQPPAVEVITDPIKVVAAKQDAVAGYLVVPTVLVLSAAEVSPDVFTDLGEAKGRKAAVDIPAGTPITPDLLEPPPDE